MTHHFGGLGAAAVFVILCANVSVTHAQPKPSDYDGLVAEAVNEYSLGNFVEARVLFEQAHRVDANARTARGLGFCAYELRHYVQAADFLREALAQKNKPLTSAQRTEVVEQLAKAKRFIGEIILAIEPATAAIQIDGAPVSLRRLPLDAGDHTLEISEPGYRSHASKLSIAGGELATVTRTLQSLATSPEQVAQAASTSAHPRADVVVAAPERDSSPSVLSRWWFWTIIGGVVVASAAAGLVVASARTSRLDVGTSGAVLRAP